MKVIFSPCGNISYVQIGSINVWSDISPTSANYDATFGSGGGANSAGAGGGRIVIKTSSNLYIYSTGILDASGTAANQTSFESRRQNTTNLGSGSGGSVAISALAVSQLGFITVAGGPAVSWGAQGQGAAGGGGRVSILVCLKYNQSDYFFIYLTY